MENDQLVLGKERPLITGSEDHTVFIKNSIKFSYFGDEFHRNNMPDRICLYNFSDPESRLCNIFKLGRIQNLITPTLMVSISLIFLRYKGPDFILIRT